MAEVTYYQAERHDVKPLRDYPANSRVPIITSRRIAPSLLPVFEDKIHPQIHISPARIEPPSHFWYQGTDNTCLPMALANSYECLGINLDRNYLECLVAYAKAFDSTGIDGLSFRTLAKINPLFGDGQVTITSRDLSQEYAEYEGKKGNVIAEYMLNFFGNDKPKGALLTPLSPMHLLEPLGSRSAAKNGHAVNIVGLFINGDNDIVVHIIDSKFGLYEIPFENFHAALDTLEFLEIRPVEKDALRLIENNRGDQYKKDFFSFLAENYSKDKALQALELMSKAHEPENNNPKEIAGEYAVVS